jgi:hypothetical protein
MIGKPIRNAVLDDPQALADARRAAWGIMTGKRTPGYRRIGNGHFSGVFSIHNRAGLVLKVGGLGGYGLELASQSHGSYGIEDAWPRYVHHTSAFDPLPEWAPRVYHVEAMRSGFYFAIMERLEKWPDADSVPWKMYDAVGLRAAAEQFDCGNDMHSGNLMLRGNTTVITDPWCANSM